MSLVRHELPSISFRRVISSLSSISPHNALVSFARNSVLLALEGAITEGCLEISDGSNVYRFGTRTEGCNQAHVQVVDENFWMHVLLSSTVAETYMMGQVKIKNLGNIMNVWLENEAGMTGTMPFVARLTATLSGLSNAFFGQTLHNSKLNVIASYDQSNELFKAFLSDEMMYSCALWDRPEGGPSGDLLPRPSDRRHDLEAAQLRKIHHVLRRARVKPGDRLLEFGSGWGALAIEAARSFGCDVDTLTLSVEQKKLAEERVREAGLEGQVRVHLMDYRELPLEFEKAFDAFVSVEMIEHVGSKYYHTYFQIVDWALKARGATAVVTSSTFPEARYTGYQAQDFMRKYMWPNSCLPSATLLVNAAHDAAQGRFTLDSIENHSAHYARTLREWNRRLDANLTQDMIVKDIPTLKEDSAAFDTFMRKWRYFFAYAGAGFLKGYITCHMLSFVREVSTELV
ncbi:cyclopropane fatty acid synthase [Amylostereum chailletii]|nr:cyclopropane fatty acid synthase [Amylostereum chailletii]